MKAILGLIVALGIPAAFWNYFLREAPDVQYSLSAAIPLGFQDRAAGASSAETDGEFVQQIEVANPGKLEAKKIVIKVPKAVSHYKLVKHASSEHEEAFSTPTSFEVIYPSLPPSGKFQITLKTIGTPLSESSLEVSHQGGKAKAVSPGSKSNDASLVSLVLSVGTMLLYVGLIYGSTRDWLKYQFLFRNYWINIEPMLSKSRPWYIRQSDWPELFSDLVSRALSKSPEYYCSISDSSAYMLLSSSCPESLPSDAWDRLKKQASSSLIDFVVGKAKKTTREPELRDLLSIRWPIGMSETAKSEINNELVSRYCEYIRDKAKTAYKESELIDLLSIHMPDEIPEGTKVKLTKELSAIYVENILRNWTTESLVNFVAQDQKPTWLSVTAWDVLGREVKKMASTELTTRLLTKDSIEEVSASREWSLLGYWERDQLTKLRDKLVIANEASAKLQEAVDLRRSVADRERDLSRRESEIASVESIASTSREKAVRQLDVIERVLADKSYLERVEPDDNTFVEGNWALLRRLVSAEKA
ncbi:MAG: hypothetical protein HYY97_16810 [Rhodocyclales bacterium]|nr:hypothetical protein [Rhodocyclales bacterium]